MNIEHRTSNIESILSTGETFSNIDIHFARFITGIDPQADSDIFLAAALVSRATGRVYICLYLAATADTALF